MGELRRWALGLFVCVSIGAGCHTVELPTPGVQVPRLALRARYTVDPESAELDYSLRSHAAGLGNRFQVLVGAAFVRYADAFLGQALEPGDDYRVRLSIESFTVEEGSAHLASRFVVERADGSPVMDELYRVEGPSQRGRPGAGDDGGEWGRTSPLVAELQRTLHGALILTFRAFLEELAAQR